MYKIIGITGREAESKADTESRERVGVIGDAKMEENCVLFHCRYNRRGDPCDKYIRTSLVQNWQKDKVTGRITVETLNSVYILDPVKTAPEKK